MRPNKLYHRILAVVFSVFTALGLANPAYAYDVYRSVTATAAAVGGGYIVNWTQANFGVSGNPPTLSFFHYATDAAARLAMPAAQCFVKVNLPATGVAPIIGATDQVGNAGIAVGGAPADQPLPFPWQIVFNNIPPGHWEIARPQITTAVTNAAASRVAASGFHNLAITAGSGVTVIDGSLVNCRAQ